MSKQLVICSVGTSQSRGCILTFVFYSQWSSLPSSLICFRIIQGFADWKKHLILHKVTREGGAISEQLVLLFPGDTAKCVGSWIIPVQVFPIICTLVSTMLSKITSSPGVGFFFSLFGHMKRLENYMDNAVAQCCPFLELWSVRCEGLCWEFPPLCLSSAYDL